MYLDPSTGRILWEGAVFLDPIFERTLERIRDNPLDMYSANGSLAADIAADVREASGILTADDLARYQVLWKEPIECPLDIHRGGADPASKLTLYTMRPESRYMDPCYRTPVPMPLLVSYDAYMISCKHVPAIDLSVISLYPTH